MHKDKILQRYNVTTQNYNIQPLFKIIAFVYYVYLFWKVNRYIFGSRFHLCFKAV